MLRWIVTNLRTFIWALALAIAVWVAAVTSADPDETRLLPYQVPIERVSQDPSLVMSTDLPASVELTLRAPRSIWEEIEANPQNVHAILDLAGLDAGEHTKELQIQVNARPVQIVLKVPDTVTFRLEPLITKTFKVDLSLTGQPAIGYQVGEAVLDPQEIVIAGARSQVEKVTRVRASINLDGIRETIAESISIEVLDAQGQPVTELTISPDSVYATMPVSQQGGYRDMAVKVVVTGRVASGYRLTDISVFPPVVTVFSTDPELVRQLPGVVETLPLDLQNANANITTPLALNLPAGASVVGKQTVLIQAGVSPIESSLTMAGEKVEVVGLSAQFTAQISPEVVDVIISGPLPVLDKLTRQDLRVTVDVTGLQAGTHQLIPKVEILIANVVVESILPSTIEVILSLANTPSPTPLPTPKP